VQCRCHVRGSRSPSRRDGPFGIEVKYPATSFFPEGIRATDTTSSAHRSAEEGCPCRSGDAGCAARSPLSSRSDQACRDTSVAAPDPGSACPTGSPPSGSACGSGPPECAAWRPLSSRSGQACHDSSIATVDPGTAFLDGSAPSGSARSVRRGPGRQSARTRITSGRSVRRATELGLGSDRSGRRFDRWRNRDGRDWLFGFGAGQRGSPGGSLRFRGLEEEARRWGSSGRGPGPGPVRPVRPCASHRSRLRGGAPWRCKAAFRKVRTGKQSRSSQGRVSRNALCMGSGKQHARSQPPLPRSQDPSRPCRRRRHEHRQQPCESGLSDCPQKLHGRR